MKDARFSPLRPRRSLTRPLEEIAIELTVFCNLKCKMCSVWELKQHGVPFDLAKKILKSARELGATRFTPCGAESFMRKDFLDVVSYVHELGYERQDIVTNGTMITDAHLDRLAATPSVALHISIDGPSRRPRRAPRRGQLPRKPSRRLRSASSVASRWGLSGVILKESLPHLRALVTLASEIGVDEVSFQTLSD